MKRSAFELGQAPAPLAKKSSTSRGELHSKLKEYPQRTVPLSTAYGRMIAHPTMSMHDACTIEKLPHYKADKTTLEERWGSKYIAELQTKARYTDLAKKWGLNPSTVLKHRQILKEETK